MNKLISIEGIDGSGKTTIVNKLDKMGYIVFKEIPKSLDDCKPSDRDSLGYSIRQLLQMNKEDTPEFRTMLANMYVNLRLDYQEEISQLLERGNVIIDRGILSTLVYGYTNDEDMNRALALSNFQTKLPDLTIYLDIDKDTSIHRLNSRLGNNDEAYKRDEAIVKNLDTYSVLADKYRDKLNIKRVDASESEDEVFNNIIALINEV